MDEAEGTFLSLMCQDNRLRTELIASCYLKHLPKIPGTLAPQTLVERCEHAFVSHLCAAIHTFAGFIRLAHEPDAAELMLGGVEPELDVWNNDVWREDNSPIRVEEQLHRASGLVPFAPRLLRNSRNGSSRTQVLWVFATALDEIGASLGNIFVADLL